MRKFLGEVLKICGGAKSSQGRCAPPPKAGLGKLCEIRPASTTQGHFANIQFPMSNPKKPIFIFSCEKFLKTHT